MHQSSKTYDQAKHRPSLIMESVSHTSTFFYCRLIQSIAQTTSLVPPSMDIMDILKFPWVLRFHETDLSLGLNETVPFCEALDLWFGLGYPSKRGETEGFCGSLQLLQKRWVPCGAAGLWWACRQKYWSECLFASDIWYSIRINKLNLLILSKNVQVDGVGRNHVKFFQHLPYTQVQLIWS